MKKGNNNERSHQPAGFSSLLPVYLCLMSMCQELIEFSSQFFKFFT